jgi:L-ascorbate metabolism protein UlaG (beta-lactamase superfamily)
MERSVPGQVSAKQTVVLTQAAFGRVAETRLWWLTNAGFLINARGTLLMIDPAISCAPGSTDTSETGHRLLVGLPIEAARVPRLEAICYTHADYDHFAPATAQQLLRTGARFIGPPPVAEQLAQLGLPSSRLEVAHAGEPIRVGGVTVMPTVADHPWQIRDPAQFGPPWGPEDCCGYLLATPDGLIWHPGDTRLVPAHLELTEIDVLLLDVSRNEYHLGVRDAARLAEALAPAVVIPHHYGSYDAPQATPHNPYNGNWTEVANRVRDGAQRFRVLAPGEEFVVTRAARDE